MSKTPSTAIAVIGIEISAKTRFTSWATMHAAPSCYGKSGRVAKWKRGSPIWRLAVIGMDACVGAHH